MEAFTAQTAVSVLHLYCQKTKVVLEEDYRHCGDGTWACSLTYCSVLREAAGHSTAASKKQSKVAAAMILLDKLLKAAT